VLDDSIGFLLSRTTRKLIQRINARFEPFGVTTEQFAVLQRLAERDGVSQKELAARVEKDQTNVTRILDQLERKRLVVRERSEEDRRSFVLRITDQGRTLSETLVPVEREAIREALGGLSAERVDALRDALNQIWSNARRQAVAEGKDGCDA